jgi:hypothetical protein
MPIDASLCSKTWVRYAYCRDNGHQAYVEKANLCDKFFVGDQWTAADRAALKLQRRPVLTINKILSTMANVMGEQIYQRTEIGFRPKSGSPPEVAEALTKVFKQISDNTQLDWKRSDMFADGIITSRGFLDVRIAFGDSLQGEVEINHLNPKNVMIDPDGEEYDPDTWRDLFTTRWVTPDDIAVLYNEEDAELLRNREQSAFPYGFDSVQMNRDRFGPPTAPNYGGGAGYDFSSVVRSVRLIERQHKMLDRQKFFVEAATGDMRAIPKDFDRNRIAWFVEKFGFAVTTKLVSRIRWTAIADNVRLHDDWSPYEHFTVVPYFPFFRRGTTVGLVENLLSSQELLNKTSSQELHIVNTTANSGYKVKAGSLTNMTPQELEARGAETGIVIEVNGDPDKDVVKITPNTVPSGLDRISYKAEEHIKSISGVSDSQQGFDREDVAAKAIQTKKQASQTNMAKPLDGLVRSDFILARNILALVQTFYTEERLLTITHDQKTGETETLAINQATPEGTIINDLTLGEYDVTTSSVPQRETLEDSQFDQALAMREAGIMIPDAVLVDASRLQKKKDIIKQMTGDQESPEAQLQKQLALRGQEAEVSKLEGEAAQKHADAGLKHAKAQKELVAAQKDADTPIEQEQGDGGAALMKAEADIHLNEKKFQSDLQLKHAEFGLRREEMAFEQQLKAKAQQDDADTARMAAATAAAQPPTQPKAAQGARA